MGIEWIVSDPFPGWVNACVKDGIVDWTGGVTPEEYLAKPRNAGLRLVSDADLMDLLGEFEGRITKDSLKEETRDEWHWALECLPPCKWRTVQGVEMFHISERITAELVDWHGRVGDRHFRLVDQSYANQVELAARFAEGAK